MMPLKSPVLTVLNILALVVVFYFAITDFFMPMVAELLYKADYKDLMFKCDSVMRDHFIAKRQAIASQSEETTRILHAAEVGLMTCHDYDVLRKRLLGFGVDENTLARIGLEVIEERAKDVRLFVEMHEIRY